MQISHRVSFPGDREYEQYTATFTLSDSDIDPLSWQNCDLLERLFLMNIVVQYEGILFQYVKGFLSREEYSSIKERLFGMLKPELKAILNKILGGVNGGKPTIEKREDSRGDSLGESGHTQERLPEGGSSVSTSKA